MKHFLFLLLTLNSLNLTAQYKTTVSPLKSSSLIKARDFLSFTNEWNDFLLFPRIEGTEKIYALVMTDNTTDEVRLTSDIRVATQVGDNHFSLAGIALAGRNLTAFVESRNFETGRNVMAMQAVDNKGGLTSEGMLVGYFDFAKTEKPGTWHITSTPDQKSIALIAQLPQDKNGEERFKYFFLNENLTITHKGEFTVDHAVDEAMQIRQFLVSNQGEFFIIAQGTGKNKGYPHVYQSNITASKSTELVFKGMIADGESGDYLGKISPEGNLIIAGYVQKSNGAGVKSALVSRTWTFSSGRSAEKGLEFSDVADAALSLKVQNLVFNHETCFLVGQSQAGLYVTGFGTDGVKKFEVPIKRKVAVSISSVEAGVATGILEDKLCLIYNEQGRSAASGIPSLRTKILAVDNQGVASAVPAAAALSSNGTFLLPNFFTANEDHMLILGKNGSENKLVFIR